jgi:hypothetical protein
MNSQSIKADRDLAGAVAAAARESLAKGVGKIHHCLDQLSDEQVWWRPSPQMNSIANLMLHLAGNIRQWLVAGIGGARDERNRPAEFADRSNRTRRELSAVLSAAVGDADKALAKLTADQLTARRRIQGFDTTVIDAIFDCSTHFQGHVQEIIHMTRQQLGPKYRFDFVPRGTEQESGAGTGV